MLISDIDPVGPWVIWPKSHQKILKRKFEQKMQNITKLLNKNKKFIIWHVFFPLRPFFFF